MDNELLKRVLSENSRIIIPGLGAFLRKEQGGALVFSPFLRTDDGKLSAIIALEYGVSPSEAQLMISEFSEKMRTILKVKSKYYIDGVGMLMIDNNGVISFMQEDPKPAAVVEQPIAAPMAAPRPTIVPSPVVEQPIFTAPAPAPAPAPVPPRPTPVAPQVQVQQPAPLAMPARPQPLAAPTPSPFARQAAPAPAPAPITPPQRPVAPPRPAPTNAARQGQAGQVPSGQKPQRPAPIKATKKSKKSDMWLVIAILAAAVVIILMVIGIMNSSQLPPIE